MRSCLIAFTALTLFSTSSSAAIADQPNIVMIMTDNHGAWTLGCYGNPDIRTPHIDRLAAEGTLFDNAFASNPVCSPTRASVLTGLVPSQHGVHCFLRGGRLQTGPEARCTLTDFATLPKELKQAGYRCGLVGKWHLGGNMTPQEGFDDYWITTPHGGTSTFYNAKVIENGTIHSEPQYLTDFWTKHAVNFIHQRAEQKTQPFFLFLSYNGPYSLSRLLLREGKNRHADYYRGKPLDSFPRETPHPWQLHNRDFQNNPISISRVATEVSGVDDGVGTVMEALRTHGLDDNTIVIFLADQGWVGGHGGFFGMGDHTRPTTATDGMMKIPMIWRQPGKIAAGRRSQKLVANYDIMPTILKQAGLSSPWSGKHPATPASPGESFQSELQPDSEQKLLATGQEDDAIFYEFETLRCIRTHGWKYTHRFPNGPHELYDLKNDPEEFDNLYANELQQPVLAALKKRLDAFYAKHASPKYDLYHGGGSQTVIYDGMEEEIAQRDPTPPPALPESFTAQSFTLPDGFSSQLVAGPPLVTHPTMSCFDDTGRLFVCNNAGVNMSAEQLEENLPNAINLLEDQDGDGVFDKSTVFADDMTFPMGGVWHDGALFVASPPNIWRLQDTDDDGVADRRDIIVDSFGYTGNAASIHGCFFGPDGRMYWCDGYHGHEFKDADGTISSKRKGSYIFSCRPDGSDVQILCGGGMDNPVEVDFTDEGEVIGTVNILYSRPRSDCLVHWQYGGAYPHREAVLEELTITGDVLGPIHHFGHVAISGTTRYRSGVANHQWRDNFFATEFNLGKVVRVELEPTGSTFSATEREFLSCDNRDFHPTDVLEDADGSLLVVDTGGWFYRGCPTSQISKPDVLGGIYRIRRDGMTTVSDPRGNRTDWAARTDSLLLRDLKDTRFAVREKVIQECKRRGIEGNETFLKSLQRTAMSADILARRNALWALTRIESERVRSGARVSPLFAATLAAAYKDRDAGIRQTACNAAASVPFVSASAISHLLADESLHVQRCAAKALGHSQSPEAVRLLARVLDRTDTDGGQATIDRPLQHAVLNAMIQLNMPQQTFDMIPELSQRVVFNLLLAIHEMSPEFLDSIPEEIRQHLVRNVDVKQLPAVMRLWSRLRGGQHAGWETQFTSLFAAQLDRRISKWNATWIQVDEGTAKSLPAWASIVTQSAHVPAVARVIGKWLDNEHLNWPTRQILLNAIATSSNIPFDSSWGNAFAALLKTDDPAKLTTILSALSATRSFPFAKEVESLAADSNRDLKVRLAASSTAISVSPKISDEVFTLLMTTVTNGGPAVSSQAAQMLSSSSLTTDQLLQVAPLLREAGPPQLTQLVPLFKRSLKPDLALAFLKSVERARSLNSLPTIEVSEVVKRFPPELHNQANALLDRMKAAEQRKVLKLDGLVEILKTGDTARGKEVFFSETAKCATCHVVGSKGKRMGPDLTTIGANRAAKDLLESIIFPSATLVRQYEPYTLLTTTGRTYSGLVVRDTAESITIQQTVGAPVTVPRTDVDQFLPATVSIMPKGIDEALTPQQIADLVAWLQSLK